MDKTSSSTVAPTLAVFEPTSQAQTSAPLSALFHAQIQAAGTTLSPQPEVLHTALKHTSKYSWVLFNLIHKPLISNRNLF
jgi:hypothetical protein